MKFDGCKGLVTSISGWEKALPMKFDGCEGLVTSINGWGKDEGSITRVID